MELKFNSMKLGKTHDLSIPVAFDEGLAEFGAHPASKTPFKAKDFVGDVEAGGSCNCDMITFSPHLHGTHTECVGHIVAEHIYVHKVLTQPLMLATLISITPQAVAEAGEGYMPDLRPEDKLITKSSIQRALTPSHSLRSSPSPLEGEGWGEGCAALIIRTGWKAGDGPAPFFSIEAMEYIVALGVQHLLVDTPSIDRMDDEGKLTAHHIFWGIEQGHHTLSGKAPSRKTVTELIHVPDSLVGRNYVLNLQVAAFAADAAPSRPLLYEIEK